MGRVLKIPSWEQLRSRLLLSQQQRRFLLRATLIALGIRVGLLLVAYVTGLLIIGRENTPVGDIILETFNRWDAPHYLRIAEVGYQAEGEDRLFIVFFPLYPLLIFVVHLFLPSYFVAALFVSAVASVAAGFVIQSIAAVDGADDAEADRSLWYMSFFPTAFFLAMPYTEALFLALSMGSFLSARNGRWAWCGVLGMLACTARMQGVALIPALAVEAFMQYRWGAPLRAFWLALVPAGILIYLGINEMVLGDPFAFVEIQKDHWGQGSGWPWQTLSDTYQGFQTSNPGSTRFTLYEVVLVGVLVAGALLIIGARWLRPSYNVYAWLSLVLMTSASFPISLPRYLLGMFPLFLVLSRLGRTPGVHNALLATSIILMGGLFVVYATRWGF